jgi:glycosyltransferase involved in cell wall biosynthesis
MNIFLAAYACEPNKGSEPEVGWQMVNEIAKVMPNDNIHVITKANNKSVIDKGTYPSNITFYYYALPKWASFYKKGGRGIRTYYYLWMIGAAYYMRKQNIAFDIVHHITFVNDWLPSFFFLLKNNDNKFVWGPIGSNDYIDSKFFVNNNKKLIARSSDFLKYFFRRFDPMYHSCKSRADYIIGINENVSNKLKLKPKHRFLAESAIAVKSSTVHSGGSIGKPSDTFYVISVGRLVFIKNFRLTILAFSSFIKSRPDIKNARLQIIGDGEDRKTLELLTKNLGISSYVEFIGKLPLNSVQNYLSRANVFLFPSLENAGFVTLEAMSNSLPVLALNYGGPQQFIKNNLDEQLVCPTQPYEAIVKGLAFNLERLFDNQKLRAKIGEKNCLDVLDNYTWEAKALKFKSIYEDLINET